MSTTHQRYAGPFVLGITRFLLVATAVVALIAGPAYWINGLTQQGASVEVSVRYVDTGEASAPDGFNPTFDTVRLSLPSSVTEPDDAAPTGVFMTVDNDDLDLQVWDSTRSEWALARGDDLVNGLLLGVGALLLWQVVGSIGRGQPFARGNAARIAGVAGAVALWGFAAPLLPLAATNLVLARLGVQVPGGVLEPSYEPDLAPLLLVAVLVVLAEAFRQGERLARETDGLV